jgi:biotin carboxyl carrier protein
LDPEENKYRIEVDDSLEVNFGSREHGLEIYHHEEDEIYFRRDGENFRAKLVELDRYAKTMTILLNGEYFKLDVSDKVDLMIEEMGLELDVEQNIKEIIAPMPGQVMEVMALPGQEIKEGDGLLVLVAMKMENLIKSPISGIISEIAVQAEDVVDKGQVLIKFQ